MIAARVFVQLLLAIVTVILAALFMFATGKDK
jgi:hypothetical protein